MEAPRVMFGLEGGANLRVVRPADDRQLDTQILVRRQGAGTWRASYAARDWEHGVAWSRAVPPANEHRHPVATHTWTACRCVVVTPMCRFGDVRRVPGVRTLASRGRARRTNWSSPTRATCRANPRGINVADDGSPGPGALVDSQRTSRTRRGDGTGRSRSTCRATATPKGQPTTDKDAARLVNEVRAGG